MTHHFIPNSSKPRLDSEAIKCCHSIDHRPKSATVKFHPIWKSLRPGSPLKAITGLRPNTTVNQCHMQTLSQCLLSFPSITGSVVRATKQWKESSTDISNFPCQIFQHVATVLENIQDILRAFKGD